MNVKTNEGLSYLFKKKKIEHESQHSKQNSTLVIYTITLEALAMLQLLYIYTSSVY